jgi:S-adenosylmethionine:tRNA ribosyltransferase-isomerase
VQLRSSHPAKPGGRIAFDGDIEAVVVERRDQFFLLRFTVPVMELLDRSGHIPLPPYIRRPDESADRERYQTVFAKYPGSVAAPTAGLHLTERLLGELRHAGVSVAEVVLHVGPATFLAGQPGRAALAVEPERYLIPPATRQQIAAVRGRGRVVAVGTTTTRALESAARAGWPEGWQTTDLVLAPGAKFEVIDALMTNFHLPGSSLLALVSAFAGTACTRAAYAAALQGGYRFYSFGDAMLIHGGVC